jgi:tryptophan 2,3-dioxygenase
MLDQADTTYGGYLRLPELLACQSPRSDTHDEMLFIVIHQATELWMKLCLHELDAARGRIAADDPAPAFKMMARVARIQAQLVQSWEVLATMTPSDYSALRPHLGSSSGFQSHQYRMIEFTLGARNADMIRLFDNTPEIAARLDEERAKPSLYDEALRLLSRRGFDVPQAVLNRAIEESYVADAGVEACWAEVYRDPERHWQLYELAEKLVDIEYRVQLWRFSHMKTVERIIGFKRGTGGTSGAPYLKEVLQRSFFPEQPTFAASRTRCVDERARIAFCYHNGARGRRRQDGGAEVRCRPSGATCCTAGASRPTGMRRRWWAAPERDCYSRTAARSSTSAARRNAAIWVTSIRGLWPRSATRPSASATSPTPGGLSRGRRSRSGCSTSPDLKGGGCSSPWAEPTPTSMRSNSRGRLPASRGA